MRNQCRKFSRLSGYSQCQEATTDPFHPSLSPLLKYANNNYTEPLTRQLADTSLDGVNAFSDGALWTGSGGRLNLRRAPSYNSVEWESPVVGEGFGRFVATDVHNGENRVFSSAWHTVAGFTYALPEPPAVTAAVSRKNHGAAGAFSIVLPITGTPGIECRRGGVDGIHTVVLTFNVAVTSGSASVTSGTGVVNGEPTFSGNQMSIPPHRCYQRSAPHRYR